MTKVFKCFSLILLTGWLVNVFAASKKYCPNLEQGEKPDSSWQVSGQIDGLPEFDRVLIATNCVMGMCALTCHYTLQNEKVVLSKVADVSPGKQSYWQTVNLGGVLFDQCKRTRKQCYYY